MSRTVSPRPSARRAPTRSRSSSVFRTATSRTRLAPNTNRNAKKPGMPRSSGGKCAISAPPGCNLPGASSPTPRRRPLDARGFRRQSAPKQQKEWTELVSMKTGEPIAAVSADDPGGFALGLGDKILGPLGAQWFYEGEKLRLSHALCLVCRPGSDDHRADQLAAA